MNSKNPTTPVVPVVPLLAAAVVLALLAALTYPARDDLFVAVSVNSPDSVTGTLAGAVASRGLLVLVAAAGAGAVWAFLRDRTALARLVAAGVGVIAAYLTSELLKLVVTEARPCATLHVATVLTCPEAGDWSWPSNHSVLAAAFATACVVAFPRSAAAVVPVALVVAVARVAAGVHYVHDVLSGLALGTAVTVLAAVALTATVQRIVPSPRHRSGSAARP